MAASRTTFEKLQRDRAKQAKAAAKRARRLEKASDEPEDETPIDVSKMTEELSAAQLLDLVEKLHKQFDDEIISFEEFEDQKTELMARLTVE